MYCEEAQGTFAFNNCFTPASEEDFVQLTIASCSPPAISLDSVLAALSIRLTVAPPACTQNSIPDCIAQVVHVPSQLSCGYLMNRCSLHDTYKYPALKLQVNHAMRMGLQPCALHKGRLTLVYNRSDPCELCKEMSYDNLARAPNLFLVLLAN